MTSTNCFALSIAADKAFLRTSLVASSVFGLRLVIPFAMPAVIFCPTLKNTFEGDFICSSLSAVLTIPSVVSVIAPFPSPEEFVIPSAIP